MQLDLNAIPLNEMAVAYPVQFGLLSAMAKERGLTIAQLKEKYDLNTGSLLQFTQPVSTDIDVVIRSTPKRTQLLYIALGIIAVLAIVYFLNRKK